MPVIRPKHERPQRCGQLATAHAGADADYVVPSIELRLDENGPAVHLSQIGESLLQCWKGLLLVAAHVAHDVAVADRVISQLPSQCELDDVRVEPEPPLPIDTSL